MAKYSWGKLFWTNLSQIFDTVDFSIVPTNWGGEWELVPWVVRLEMFSTPGGGLFGKGGEACARSLSTNKPRMELKGHSETLYCYDAESFFVGYADIHRHLAEENDDLQQQIKHLEQAQFRLSQAVEFAKDDRKGDFWTHRADIAKDVNQRLAKAKKAADSTPKPNGTDRQAQRQTEQTRLAQEKIEKEKAQLQAEQKRLADEKAQQEQQHAKQQKELESQLQQEKQTRLAQEKARKDIEQKALKERKLQAQKQQELETQLAKERQLRQAQEQAQKQAELQRQAEQQHQRELAAQKPENIAKKAMEQKDFKAAKNAYKQLCEEQPQNIEARLGYAKALFSLAEQAKRTEQKRKQLTSAKNQLEQAGEIDEDGDHDEIYDVLEEINEKLDELQIASARRSPHSSASMQRSAGSSGSAENQHPIPGTITTVGNHSINFGDTLGKGGSGTVYCGNWNQKEVAIKRFNTVQMRLDELTEFVNETKFALEELSKSDYLVKAYDYTTSPYYCIVMEYMPHGSLYQVLGSDQDLPWDKRWVIAMDIAHGVSALHSKDIVHRDIKSLNVLIGHNMRAKLADFGQAKLKTSSKSVKTRRSQTGAVGTTAWLAPEVARGDSACSIETDMYSFGMTLWELGSRKRPYDDADTTQMMENWVKQHKTPDLKEIPKPKLAHLIQWCWEANPRSRPSAQKAIEAIQACRAAPDALRPS